MRALITGGAGFIGSHLAEHLLEQGDEVTILDNLTTGRFENVKQLTKNPRFRYFIGAVEEAPLFHEAAESAEAIYHLAAAVGVELIVRDPVRTIETNVEGTQLVLRHAVKYGKRVLITSTSEVYGKGTQIPFKEEDDVLYGPTSKPRWAYAISKAVDEFLMKAYVETKGLSAVTVRLFNTVGPRQVGQYGMVIPRFIAQAMSGAPMTVYGDGSQRRCFGHVLDIVPALRKLLVSDEACGRVVNLGSDTPITIMDLAKKVRALVDPQAQIRVVPYETAFGASFEDMTVRQPSLELAKRLVGFQTARDIDRILQDVVTWMKSQREGMRLGGV